MAADDVPRFSSMGGMDQSGVIAGQVRGGRR
jgi:hypothetical protein